MSEQVRIQVCPIDENVKIPVRGSELASGFDVHAHISEAISVPAHETVLVPTGLKVEIPAGYEIQVRPRSGLAIKHQLTVLNSPGTVDADYRGEIKVILINHGNSEFIIEPEMRIAQLVVAPVIMDVVFTSTEELACSSRGEGGFGHTGI